ncbi:pseudouridine synthase [Atopobacter phocae]|uniref:pseudouridine synthase n=1 Tax=Atopobacter phocae TaxID=136492 RepID=UPI00046E6880|nr:pseudouridine synthase [Atopobacter phocae]
MERLQKVLAQAGIASRRKSEEIIQSGRVTVNGQVVTELGVKVGMNDHIKVDGVLITKEEKVYYLFYKPKNVLSSVSDDRGRSVVVDYFETDKRIYPVGRLDFDTTGVLLMTNDGEFSQSLMHPKFQVEKEYIATISGVPTDEKLLRLERGIQLEKGKTSPAKVKVIKRNTKKNTAIISLVIHEGWNHQVKKMFEAIGHPVMKLKRERVAFLTLGQLTPGEHRPLKPYEIVKLKQLSGQDSKN